MHNFPKISIVTPSYNQDYFLEKTIQSVLNQNYPNLEYIIIDGGSKDKSIEIIKKYEKYLTFWKSEPDNGQYDAINQGFAKATGEIMTWLNSDDLLFKGALEQVSKLLTHYKEIKWLGGCLCQIDESSNVVMTIPQDNWNRFRYILKDFKYIQQEGTFWTRDLWEKSGATINTDFNLASDLELWLRFFQHSNFYTVNFPLGCFRLRAENQKSLDLRKAYDDEAFQILNNFEFAAEDKKIIEKFIFYRKIIYRLPLVDRNKILKSLFKDNIYNFPPKLIFDQMRQNFLYKGNA